MYCIPHPYKRYLLSVDVSVMNMVYRELSAGFLHLHKRYVLSIDVKVIYVLIMEISAVSYICSLFKC
jgi:hypothetical protein